MFVGALVLLYMFFFSFLAPRFVSTTANSSVWLPYLLCLLCFMFLFYIRYYGNFSDEMY